jgi:hypothetical protein
VIPGAGKEVGAFSAKIQRLVQYYKGEPNVHVIRYRNGKPIAHGPGLTFWYLPFNTTIAAVPVISQDAQFIFNEATRDFQAVAIQGSLAYRLTAPLEAAKALDFTIDPSSGRYRSKDSEKLAQRIINAVQAYTRTHVSALSLEDALTKVRALAAGVLQAVNTDGALRSLGVLVEGLHFTGVTATPEMRKALEADYREALQQKADQAIYARRAKSVEEERRIKERELETEVELENRKKDLVDMQARNQLALAEAEAKAEELKLSPYGALAPQVLVGLALKEWASAGGQIGNLSITPDMLGQLVGWVAGGRK